MQTAKTESLSGDAILDLIRRIVRDAINIRRNTLRLRLRTKWARQYPACHTYTVEELAATDRQCLRDDGRYGALMATARRIGYLANRYRRLTFKNGLSMTGSYA